jgi:lysozyme
VRRIVKGRKPAYGRIIGFLLMAVIVCFGIPYAVRLKKIYTGEIIANIPDFQKYPVMGVDVSRYQGNIDWPVIASQNIKFAFIKATEGSSHQDPCFAENWEEVKKTNIYSGAYHFFSFESSGETQAQNFINTVGDLENTNLPPVIDLEFYGDYSAAPLSRKETQEILNTLLKRLEEYYHVKPIIYTTSKAYCHYMLGGGYGEYPLWFRNTYQEPFAGWSFWQYSDKGRLKGYDGIQSDCTEMCIDMNVYHSSYEAFLEEFSLPEITRETLDNDEKEAKEDKT